MAQWHRQYHEGIANERAAKKRAAISELGEYYIGTDGEEYIAWPNGEVSTASEYEHWLAGRVIVAQYGEHG